MRAFYLAFPNRNALRTDLSWTHYRILLRIDNLQAREWYMAEAASQQWSSRALERQISTLYYERLLSSQDRTAVEQEAETLTRPLAHQDVGQMDSYILIYDQHYKEHDDNPTIGLILCSQKSEAVVKYSVLTDSAQMFAAKYPPYLPTE